MKSYFQKKVLLGFLAAISIIAWLAITSYRNNKQSEETAKWVTHANSVLFHAEQVMSVIVDLESAQLGYGLTGIEEFLEPSNTAADLLNTHARSLKELTANSPTQRERFVELEKLINQKIQFSINGIDARKKQGIEGARSYNASMVGKRLTDNIRALIVAIQMEEENLLKERTQLVRSRINRFNTYFVGMLFATGLILVLLFYSIHVNLAGRAEAENSLRLASERIRDMYDNAPCGYHSLDRGGIFLDINSTWLNWLKTQRDQVVNKLKFEDILTPESAARFKLNFNTFKKEGVVRDEEYEVQRKDGTTFQILLNETASFDESGNFVKSRSTALDFTQQKIALRRIEQLNQELESFSYSVSHDLRAPLRSIDGYTQILLEDYAGSLDDEGKRILNVVVNNARRMAKLIDDLLDFSRVGRKEISKSVVNTEAMVQSVVNELMAQEQHREIDLRVQLLDPSDADPNLLRQVWINLISNALKYTRKKDVAVIEISSEKNGGEIVFSVKDNGTGFDMQYAGKLFGVFQRLHRHKDFEGTGVGLAIVHRIVSRHGGKVWAEGEVDNGATFHFSLPNTDIT